MELCSLQVVGSFRVDINRVKISDLKAMRKLLPRGKYKQIKNRKCARMSRYRRKEVTLNLQEQNRQLREENARLRMELGLSPAHGNNPNDDSPDNDAITTC